jgi:BMFP domain-containing protein YqiC
LKYLELIEKEYMMKDLKLAHYEVELGEDITVMLQVTSGDRHKKDDIEARVAELEEIIICLKTDMPMAGRLLNQRTSINRLIDKNSVLETKVAELEAQLESAIQDRHKSDCALAETEGFNSRLVLLNESYEATLERVKALQADMEGNAPYYLGQYDPKANVQGSQMLDFAGRLKAALKGDK